MKSFLQKLFGRNEVSNEVQSESLVKQSERRILHQIQRWREEDKLDDAVDMNTLNVYLKKIETGQKEIVLQIDTLSESILDDSFDESRVWAESLIGVLDVIEDFYRFALASPDSPYAEQAKIMWQTAQDSTNELEVIDEEGKIFDFRKHLTEGTDCDPEMPNGYVIKTLKCGYEYKGEVLRRASVIVNRQPTQSKN